MWFSKPKNPDERNVLYIAIDGRSIGIAFYIGTDCVYGERRIHILGESERPIEVLFKDIIFAFKHTIPNKIDEIIVILESPWVKELQSSIKEKRLRPFQIEDKTIERIIQKDKSMNKQGGFSKELGYSIENVKLNGYTYKDPIGKITEEIEILITRFWGDEDIINLVDKILKDFWNRTKIKYTSGGKYIFKIGKKLNVANDMYISLGSTDTTIRIYSQGVVSQKILIPFGFQNVLQNLGALWKTMSTETKNWIDLFIENNLSSKESKRIENDIVSAVISYYHLMNDAGNSLALERPITIFGADKTWNKLFIYLLKHKYFGEIFPHIDTTNIIDITSEVTDKEVDALIGSYVDLIKD